jgi:hypothetical protein
MKSVSGRSSGIDSQVEHLSSTVAYRIEETKRRFVVELLVRRGEFWDMVCGLRDKYSILSRVELPNDESEMPGMPLLPEDRPRHRPTSCEVLPGLGIGPCWAVHLEVVQDRDKEAAPSRVEHGCQDEGDRQDPDDVEAKRPGTLRGPAEKECRRMPEAPERTQNQARPQANHFIC